MKNVLELLANDGFIMVNKKLMKLVGLHGAVLIGDLASKQLYWESKSQLTLDGYFYCSAANIQENTGLSYKQQLAEFKHLEEVGILYTDLRGIPKAKYFKLNTEKLMEIFYGKQYCFQKGNNRDDKTETIEATKGNTNNNKEIIKINNNINNQFSDNSETIDSKCSISPGGYYNKDYKVNTVIYKLDENLTNDKTKSVKVITEYINQLPYKDLTKQDLQTWYQDVAKSKISLGQLKDRLKNISVSVNNNETKIRNSIREATDKHWLAFYNNSYKQPDYAIRKDVIEKPLHREIRVGDEVF